MTPDSIILDIDGTLWDSTPVVAEGWNHAISSHPGIDFRLTPKHLLELFGRPLKDIADIAFPFLDEAERYALLNECLEQEELCLQTSDKDLLYPGVADTIRTLSEKYKLFIVSNCQSGYIELFLDKTGLGAYIIDFECNGNNGLSKGQNIHLIIERNHLTNAVYVGDIKGDQAASKEAGIPFCHASYGFGTVEDPDYTIRQFSDLLTIF